MRFTLQTFAAFVFRLDAQAEVTAHGRWLSAAVSREDNFEWGKLWGYLLVICSVVCKENLHFFPLTLSFTEVFCKFSPLKIRISQLIMFDY